MAIKQATGLASWMQAVILEFIERSSERQLASISDFPGFQTRRGEPCPMSS